MREGTRRVGPCIGVAGYDAGRDALVWTAWGDDVWETTVEWANAREEVTLAGEIAFTDTAGSDRLTVLSTASAEALVGGCDCCSLIDVEVSFGEAESRPLASYQVSAF